MFVVALFANTVRAAAAEFALDDFYLLILAIAVLELVVTLGRLFRDHENVILAARADRGSRVDAVLVDIAGDATLADFEVEELARTANAALLSTRIEIAFARLLVDVVVEAGVLTLATDADIFGADVAVFALAVARARRFDARDVDLVLATRHRITRIYRARLAIIAVRGRVALWQLGNILRRCVLNSRVLRRRVRPDLHIRFHADVDTDLAVVGLTGGSVDANHQNIRSRRRTTKAQHREHRGKNLLQHDNSSN